MEKPCETCYGFYDMRRYPTVIWISQHLTSAFKIIFWNPNIRIFSCVTR